MPARWGREVKTLDHAWREFRAKPSPRVLAVGIVVALVVRAVYGDFHWEDLAVIGAILAIYPFSEWAIHVYLLHMPPFQFRGRSVYLTTAKSHWAHHKEPRDLGMILLAPGEVAALLLLAAPATTGLVLLPLSLVLDVSWGMVLTGVLTGYLLIGVYEWTHFLIHTAHRPRSRYYRSIWRGHRLHHFKNERYWHGITNTVSDRVLGTNPDQQDVPRSPTARTLRS
jgi:hypothetical protein